MSDSDGSSDPLDLPTSAVLGRRAVSHPLVESWAFRPDALSTRRLELTLDGDQFPEPVTEPSMLSMLTLVPLVDQLQTIAQKEILAP